MSRGTGDVNKGKSKRRGRGGGVWGTRAATAEPRQGGRGRGGRGKKEGEQGGAGAMSSWPLQLQNMLQQPTSRRAFSRRRFVGVVRGRGVCCYNVATRCSLIFFLKKQHAHNTHTTSNTPTSTNTNKALCVLCYLSGAAGCAFAFSPCPPSPETISWAAPPSSRVPSDIPPKRCAR